MDGVEPAVKVGNCGKGGKKRGEGGEEGEVAVVGGGPLFVGMLSGCTVDFLQNLEQAEVRME